MKFMMLWFLWSAKIKPSSFRIRISTHKNLPTHFPCKKATKPQPLFHRLKGTIPNWSLEMRPIGNYEYCALHEMRMEGPRWLQGCNRYWAFDGKPSRFDLRNRACKRRWAGYLRRILGEIWEGFANGKIGGSLKKKLLGGTQTMQMYSSFEGFPLNSALFGFILWPLKSNA